MKDIHSEHYTVVLPKKSTSSLRTYQILNNAAESQEFSNAADVSRNSLTVYVRCSKCPPFARKHLRSRPRH